MMGPTGVPVTVGNGVFSWSLTGDAVATGAMDKRINAPKRKNKLINPLTDQPNLFLGSGPDYTTCKEQAIRLIGIQGY